MNDPDYEAAYDIASDMTFVEAAKFLRAEIGYTLLQAAQRAERIAQERPDSPLAASLYNRAFEPMQIPAQAQGDQ
jgi:hypothetical protein